MEARMGSIRLSRLLIITIVGCGISTFAVADNALNIYVGAGAGESHLRTGTEVIDPSGSYDGPDYKFDAHHSAWKMIAGIRPIAPLGIELEYIDFGNPSTGVTLTGPGALLAAGAKAVTVFGLGYLPLPVPFLDVYGKLGLARLRTTLTEISPTLFCPAKDLGVVSCAQVTSNQSDWSTNLAYGAGVQGKMGDLAVRAEYERINAGTRTPDIVSVGVTWTF
jgi:opacity protein-like surface antigen